jgi:hypothetical protein
MTDIILRLSLFDIDNFNIRSCDILNEKNYLAAISWVRNIVMAGPRNSIGPRDTVFSIDLDYSENFRLFTVGISKGLSSVLDSIFFLIFCEVKEL